MTDGQFTGGQFTGGQATDPCPQCGNTAAVHSIGELAALAQMQLDKLQGGIPQPGAAQHGWNAEPQAGPPQGWNAQPQAGPPQGWNAQPQAGPPQGWNAEPQAGPPPGSGGWIGRSRSYSDSPIDSIDQAIADVALGAAARFIGRAVAKRVQRTVNERVMPAVANNQQAMLRAQIAIAEQHPDVRACMTDNVIFLAGGSRVLPMPNLALLTTQQADALVAQLRQS